MRYFLSLSLISSAFARSFCNQTGWATVFYEGFDYPPLNASRWSVLNATVEGDRSCREARCMASNVEVSGGMLHLTAQREDSGWARYTSGAVETRDKSVWDATTGGGSFRVCIFAQIPGGDGGTGAGYWPTFRMLPNDDSCWPDHGELDFMEQLNGGDTFYSTYRTAPAGAPACSNTSASEGGSIPELADTYNEYALGVYEDGTFDLLVNNDLVYEYNSTAGLPIHLVPWFLNLGFAIGGGRPEPPNASTAFPAVVNVDWVQVVSRAGGKRGERGG